LSENRDPLFQLLVRRSRGEARAAAILEDLSIQLGMGGWASDRVLTAIALIKTGMTPDSVSSLISWVEFEGFCAGLLTANGYRVKRNIVITKPRRQIDIFAESSDLALCVDCKHWGKGFSGSELERIVREQVERSSSTRKSWVSGFLCCPSYSPCSTRPAGWSLACRSSPSSHCAIFSVQ
jgi:hypothetical protein